MKSKTLDCSHGLLQWYKCTLAPQSRTTSTDPDLGHSSPRNKFLAAIQATATHDSSAMPAQPCQPSMARCVPGICAIRNSSALSSNGGHVGANLLPDLFAELKVKAVIASSRSRVWYGAPG